MKAGAVLETCLYASDLDAAERFYTKVLGLEVLSRAPGRHVFFRCGRGVFLVFDAARTAREALTIGGRPIPLHGATGAGHAAFAMAERDLDAWRAQLEAASVPIDSEVEWPGGGRSLYFRDPAGNSVELATPRIWGLAE
jgi:catechol 2,3-dioxygenase-like lactoylglutathione lyase family enzyme